jgi:hypothetical protein
MYILCVCFEKERLVKDYYIDGRNFANFHWGRAFNPNNPTQTHSIYVKLEKKSFLGMLKIRALSMP